MRKFIINVNGNSYEVEVEEVGGAVSAPSPVAAPVAAAPAAAPKAAPAPQQAAPKAAATAGSVTVSSPMPGTIVSVKVSVGDDVKKGDILCVLEAMKMENEIFAPQDGKVVAIGANQGATVNTGDTLVSLG